MRINRKEPKHWYYLVRGSLNLFISMPFRIFRNKKKKKQIVFYDQMNGNTKSFVEYLLQQKSNEYDIYYLAFPEMQRIFSSVPIGTKRLNPLKFLDMLTVSQSDVVISAFKPDMLVFYQFFTSIKFVDIWHGVPYRGYTENHFRDFKRYDQTWISSEKMRKFYDLWGWDKDKVKVTGYARIDDLATANYSRNKLRQKYGVDPKFYKVVVIAPTWEQKDGSHTIFPFGSTGKEFLDKINSAGRETNSLIVLRLHLESQEGVSFDKLSNVRFLPSGSYPDTEEILYIADVLVSDWSSIVFDYLPLHRPTIFLDVDFPYKDGYTVDARYRFGRKVTSVDELYECLKAYVNKPKSWEREFKGLVKESEELVWGDTLDGKSSERYLLKLRDLLK
jgi:CDP-glycerol glycerophosphotransferase (TagB/SpsB family)